MKTHGYSLTELMVAMMVLTIVAGVVFSFAIAMGSAVRIQESQVTASDDARLAMMRIVRELRQAARQSINWASLPGGQITYRVADDIDGNGTAVDQGGALELSGIRRIGRDTTDLNGDGLLAEQLVLVDGPRVLVLANNLMPPGIGGVGQGLWFEQADQGVRITLQTQHATSPRDPQARVSLVEVVAPRN